MTFYVSDTVDEKNPAPVEVNSPSPLFTEFCYILSVVIAAFLNHQPYRNLMIHWGAMHESHAGSPVSGKRCLELGSGTGAGCGDRKKKKDKLLHP